MFDKLRSIFGKKKRRFSDEARSEKIESTGFFGARNGESRGGGGDDGDYDFEQAESDGWVAPDMADVLGAQTPLTGSNRGPKGGSNRAGGAPSRGSKKQRKEPSARERTRKPSARQVQPPARRPPPRGPLEHSPIREASRADSPRDIDVEDIDNAEALHGSYDTVGSIQRGIDLFHAGEPTPNVFMPHLAAHGEYPSHLALPYNMEHVHPSLYQGAPLISGFPAHDRILESLQQNHRGNYRGRRG